MSGRPRKPNPRNATLAIAVDALTLDRIARVCDHTTETPSGVAYRLLTAALAAELERLGLPLDRPAESGEWLAADPFAETDDETQAARLRNAGYDVEVSE
jgi:hypothetical protein